MSKTDLPGFAAALSKLNLREVDLAVAMLWYEDHQNPAIERTAADLASVLEGHSLCSAINRSRLTKKLRDHPDTVSPNPGRFKIRLSSKHRLNDKYEPFLGTRVVVVTDTFLPESQTKGTRPYIEKLARQINGCYEAAFYDACAVLCRRLTESLLIEAFEKAGKGQEIKNGREYKQFGEIIGIAKSGHHIKLGRNTGPALDDVKKVGDTAAHDRTYVTTKPDVDGIAHDFRRTISELMGLADIHPTA